MRICQIVMSKSDILTRFTFHGPEEADASGILTKAAQASAPLLTT